MLQLFWELSLLRDLKIDWYLQFYLELILKKCEVAGLDQFDFFISCAKISFLHWPALMT